MKKSNSIQSQNWKGLCASLFLLMSFVLISCKTEDNTLNEWPEITEQTKPWTRWWWMGSAVDKANITAQLEAFAENGLGGVEITPIYGVRGYEEDFLDYLSPEWLDMLDYTLSEANRLRMGVDIVLGTGWPYGGQQVEPHYAASRLGIRKYPIKAGETFDEIISMEDPKQNGLAELQYLIYFDEAGEKIDLTPQIEDNRITFMPSSETDIYAVFCGKTRQKVKRSAPGGEGYALDHFSEKAFKDYVIDYNDCLPVFQNRIRGIFNDSYEVYNADYTAEFMSEFQNRRNYDLLDYVPLLIEKPDSELYARILCDYRESISDLLLEDFAETWNEWCNNQSFITRYQAHGSPGNLIDLYAVVDIPECEVFGSPAFDIPGYRRDTANIRKGDANKMMLKFCSSSAHLQGKEVVSSESFTWLREHFKTSLSHCKPVVEDLFLSGVNHVFLHGSTYSPQEETWPGWKFYASVNFNPTNTIWKDSRYLFNYIARCQSILQNAKTDNEVLLYWPIYDAYSSASRNKLVHQFSIHTIDEWLLPTSFYQIATELDENGFGFDFISDKFVLNTSVNDNLLAVSENAKYKILIVPEMKFIPIATMEKLVDLKNNGANIVFMGQPETIAGLFQYKQQEERLLNLIRTNGKLFSDESDVQVILNKAGIFGEKAAKSGLKIIRKQIDGNKIYFIANHSNTDVDTYIPFNAKAKSALIMDPISGKTGAAKIRANKNTTEVKLSLKPGETIFLKMSKKPFKTNEWNYPRLISEITINKHPWTLEFIEGGPIIPENLSLQELQSWTNFGTDYENFSGTVKYSTSFDIEEASADGYFLEMKDLRESARVYLNGAFVGGVFSYPYSIEISEYIITGNNKLEIEVTNLGANRLRELERSGKEWKNFYNINIVNIHYKTFDAKNWKIEPSGLTGDIKLKRVSFQ